MSPDLRQKYLLWLYQNPGQHSVAKPAAALGIDESLSVSIARYLIAEHLADGKTWAMIDDSRDGFLEIAPKGMKVIENNVPHNEIQRPVVNHTVVHGNNSGVIANTTASGNASISVLISNKQDVSELFQKLQHEIRDNVSDTASCNKLIAKLDELKCAYELKDKPSFLKRYQEFVGLVASHIDLFNKVATNAIPAVYGLLETIT